MAIIYMTTCRVSGKKYVGQSRQTLRLRSIGHRNSARSGATTAIASAIRKYGFESFSWEVLEQCEPSLLDEREIALIKQHDTICPHGYNIEAGGSSVIAHNKHSRKQEEDASLPKYVHRYQHATGSGYRVCLPDGRRKAFMSRYYSTAEKRVMAEDWCREATANDHLEVPQRLRRKEDSYLPTGVTRYKSRKAGRWTYVVLASNNGKLTRQHFRNERDALDFHDAMHSLMLLAGGTPR